MLANLKKNPKNHQRNSQKSNLKNNQSHQRNLKKSLTRKTRRNLNLLQHKRSLNQNLSPKSHWVALRNSNPLLKSRWLKKRKLWDLPQPRNKQRLLNLSNSNQFWMKTNRNKSKRLCLRRIFRQINTVKGCKRLWSRNLSLSRLTPLHRKKNQPRNLRWEI